MERLTYYSMKGSENDGWYLKPGVTREAAMYRLASYESTGLTPVMFRAAFTEESLLKLTAQYFKTTPDRLLELIKANGESRLVVLPFPVGTNIGNSIKNARKAAGLTQEELAKELGINRATISKYEKGMIEPSISQLNKIAKILNMGF